MEFQESRNKIKKMSGIPRTFAKKSLEFHWKIWWKKYGIPMSSIGGWFIIIWNSPFQLDELHHLNNISNNSNNSLFLSSILFYRLVLTGYLCWIATPQTLPCYCLVYVKPLLSVGSMASVDSPTTSGRWSVMDMSTLSGSVGGTWYGDHLRLLSSW